MMAEPLDIALSGYSIMMKLGLLRLISSVDIIFDNSILIRALIGVEWLLCNLINCTTLAAQVQNVSSYLACDIIVNAIGYKICIYRAISWAKMMGNPLEFIIEHWIYEIFW